MNNRLSKKFGWKFGLIGILILLISVFQGVPLASAEITACERVWVDSPSLGPGLFGTHNSSQEILIFLPADYETSGLDYPVVYFQAYDLEQTRLQFVRNYYALGTWTEFISVITWANLFDVPLNPYYNSPISGYWENFLTQDVVPYVDSNYRTIPDAENRGWSAYSFWVGVLHPDQFGVVQGVNGVLNYENGTIPPVHKNPDYIAEFLQRQIAFQAQIEDITDTSTLYTMFQDEYLDAFRNPAPELLKILYEQGFAYAPNVTKHGVYMNFPYIGNSTDYQTIPEILGLWDQGNSNLRSKLQYHQNTMQDQDIQIVYNENWFRTEFNYIPEGNAELCSIMSELGISHSEESLSETFTGLPAVSDITNSFFTSYTEPIRSENAGNIPGYTFGSLFGFTALIGAILLLITRKKLLS